MLDNGAAVQLRFIYKLVMATLYAGRYPTIQLFELAPLSSLGK